MHHLPVFGDRDSIRASVDANKILYSSIGAAIASIIGIKLRNVWLTWEFISPKAPWPTTSGKRTVRLRFLFEHTLAMLCYNFVIACRGTRSWLTIAPKVHFEVVNVSGLQSFCTVYD